MVMDMTMLMYLVLVEQICYIELLLLFVIAVVVGYFCCYKVSTET